MERIHVSVRARPLSAEDAKSSPWRISGNTIFIPNQHYKFEFDRIFGEECKTAEVYRARTKDIVAAAVRGFNGTVFAYGQTNSGKTHTMRGSAYERGVIPLAVFDLFDTIQKEGDREFLLRMSYMEIYNEEINDLLAPEHRKLQIHESVERGIFVAGLREEIVASPDQVLELMEFGESHRHIGETNMNVYSSRSHTIFRMIIESREKTEDADNSCDAVRVSVLNLVDLAGSERAAKTGAEGVRLKEGSHINKSLMTLGTVIKKLSEGAESQGGHVPYRDSKLTRILQPALGGNANTAIICNITLAQIHADETKSSLQFASRAIRVTNCVHVNEILTDAALLKRQKKEIEELRAKLQGSHSEHLEEEILNLRNTLLTSELERERIALELEEEKKAQAERERRLQEQAKKIENLSSMVLCSNREENRDVYKKEKRRDTWCPGNLSRETLRELQPTITEKLSAVKPMRLEHNTGPLLPFAELVNEVGVASSFMQEDDCKNGPLENCTLPDPGALLHVTSRRKGSSRKKSLLMENNELAEMQTEYEGLLIELETQRIVSEIQIDYLTRRLAEAGPDLDMKYKDNCTQDHKATSQRIGNANLRESEAILVIKQLQEKIRVLEMEKSSSQENLDCVVELATEQTISAREKYEELYQELLDAREETKAAQDHLASFQSARVMNDEYIDSLSKLSWEVQQMMLEVEEVKNLTGPLSSIMDDLSQCVPGMSNHFVDLKSFALSCYKEMNSLIRDHETLQSYWRRKINTLEDEKVHLHNQSLDLQNQLEELDRKAQDSANSLIELTEQYEMEKAELLSQIQTLQKEISCLSSSSLAREKESMRKDLEKAKAKLRDAESKLKNAIQEKTKLEGEKVCAEREIKRLLGQKAILERDMNKRDSIIGKRRDSVLDRSSNAFDVKRQKGPAGHLDQAMQEEYRKLEVLAFEMETTIASLEEELAIMKGEKEEAFCRAESLACELEALSDELNVSNSELKLLNEEVISLRSSIEKSRSYNRELESSLSALVEDKDELAMQLTDALLAMEEEKAIWSSKEKASVEAIEEKSKAYNAEIVSLSKGLLEVKEELVSCRQECKVLKERLIDSERHAMSERKFSEEKSVEIDRLRDDLKIADDERKRSQEIFTSQLALLTLEHHQKCDEIEKIRLELIVTTKERDDIMNRVKELEAGLVETDNFQLLKSKQVMEELSDRLSGLEVKMHHDEVNTNKEKAKLRMRLRGAQTKLDNFRVRYKEALDEMDLMNQNYEAASAKLKDQLASKCIEVLNLKKQLASLKV